MCAPYQPCLSFCAWRWKQDAAWQRLGTTQRDAAAAAVSTPFHTRKATLVSQDCGGTFLVMWWDLSDNQCFFRMKGPCVFSHASWKMITFKPYFWCSKPLCQWHQTNKIWFTTTIALVDAVGHPRQLLLDLPFPWHSSRKKMKTDLFLYSLPTLQTAAVEDDLLNFSTESSIFIPSSPVRWPHWTTGRPISRLKKMTDTDEWYVVSTRETSPNRMSLWKSTLIFKSFGNFTWHFTMCSAFVMLSLVKHLYHTWHLLFLSCWHLVDKAAKTWRTVGDISLLPTEIWNSSRHLSLQHLVRWNEEWTYWLAGTNLFQSRVHHWFISLTQQRESIFRLLLKLNPATLGGFHPKQRFFQLKCDLKSDRSWFSN